MAQITKARKELSFNVHSLINAKAKFKRIFGQTYYSYLSKTLGSRVFCSMKDNLNRK